MESRDLRAPLARLARLVPEDFLGPLEEEAWPRQRLRLTSSRRILTVTS